MIPRINYAVCPWQADCSTSSMRMDAPSPTRESSLKCMTRSLASMPTGAGKRRTFKYSFDLRYTQATPLLPLRGGLLDPAPEAQDKRYAFKRHRQTIDDVDHFLACQCSCIPPNVRVLVTLLILRLTFMTFTIATTRFHPAGSQTR